MCLSNNGINGEFERRFNNVLMEKHVNDRLIRESSSLPVHCNHWATTSLPAPRLEIEVGNILMREMQCDSDKIACPSVADYIQLPFILHLSIRATASIKQPLSRFFAQFRILMQDLIPEHHDRTY